MEFSIKSHPIVKFTMWGRQEAAELISHLRSQHNLLCCCWFNKQNNDKSLAINYSIFTLADESGAKICLRGWCCVKLFSEWESKHGDAMTFWNFQKKTFQAFVCFRFSTSSWKLALLSSSNAFISRMWMTKNMFSWQWIRIWIWIFEI